MGRPPAYLLHPRVLTVLSVTPAFLLFCACELSPGCIARSFGNFLIGPLGVRKPAIVIMLGPLVVLLTYVVVFLRCHRRRDVLDFSDRSVRLSGAPATP